MKARREGRRIDLPQRATRDILVLPHTFAGIVVGEPHPRAAVCYGLRQ